LPRLDEHVVDEILRILPQLQDAQRDAKHRARVAVVELAEGGLVAHRRRSHQALVASRLRSEPGTHATPPISRAG
jgi:hypothetical protein